MKGLNERLKEARIGLHLSQEYVAKCLGLNRTAIVQIEAGKRNVSAEELSLFSQIYSISADELLYGKDLSLPESFFARRFSELDESDQHEIMNLIEFKKRMKEQLRR